MKKGKRYWKLVDPVWDAVSIYDGEVIFLEQFSKAPEAGRTLFAAHWCQSEVNNGGLHQFFGNSTGVLAPEAVAAFREIGMPAVADVVETATRWFGAEYPRDRDMRNEKLDKWESINPDESDPFDKLSDEFFTLIETEAGGFETAADTYAEKQTNGCKSDRKRATR